MLVKANAIELLRKELARKRVKGPIGLGSMNDCYMPLEREVNLTGRALKVIAEFGFPVHVMTKSDLVLRDLETLVAINERYATVSFTITTPMMSWAKSWSRAHLSYPIGSKRCAPLPIGASRPASR